MKDDGADSLAKHQQQHRLGVPLETRHDCPACNRQRVYDDSEARRERLDYIRSR